MKNYKVLNSEMIIYRKKNKVIFTFLALVIIFSNNRCMISRSQKDNIFNNGSFCYEALYINSKGDTITKDTLVLSTLNRKWFLFGDQEAVVYKYLTDIEGYKLYIDPDPFFKKKNQDYFNKKGEPRLNKKETTGAYSDSTYFFVHPPRSNQFRMLSYGAYPTVKYNLLTDTITHGKNVLNIYGLGCFNQEYQIEPISDSSFFSSSFKTITKKWKIEAQSNLNCTRSTLLCDNENYNSSLEAVFCKEYGFLKLNYTFQCGIRINLELKLVTKK